MICWWGRKFFAILGLYSSMAMTAVLMIRRHSRGGASWLSSPVRLDTAGTVIQIIQRATDSSATTTTLTASAALSLKDHPTYIKESLAALPVPSSSTRHEQEQWKGRCFRTACPMPRRNHIVFNNQNGAGLNDRMSVIQKLTGLAGYLCAELHVTPPHVLLTRKHNDGVPLSPTLRWADLINVTFGPDGQTPMQLTWYDDIAREGQENGLWWLPDDDGGATSDREGLVPALYLTSKSKAGNWDIFMRLENFTQQQQLRDRDEGAGGGDFFLWEISTNLYGLDLFDEPNPTRKVSEDWPPPSFPMEVISKLTPGKRKRGCKYQTNNGPSEYVQDLTERIWNNAVLMAEERQQQGQIIGALHVRRGDAMGQCKTTITKMRSYLECSFAGSKSLGRNITVLLSTDEKSEEYLNRLISILEDDPSYGHIRITPLDGIIWEHARDFVTRDGHAPERILNNYLVFLISQTIQKSKAQFFMEQRRHFQCKPCQPVQDLLSK